MAIDDALTPQKLLSAARFVAGRGVGGMVWLDRDLIVTARFGQKADFIALGAPVTDSVIPFIGSEDEIRALQHDPSASIELPGVVIHAASGQQERYNLSLYWMADEEAYLLTVSRASLDAALEVELLRHVRFRLMAEDEIEEKSRELARANRDLEDFAAIISHDLKAPMRAMRYMTDDIDTALTAGTVEDARGKIAWMRSQTSRMSSMLSALLDYSSIGRKLRALEKVDTLELAHAIARSLPLSSGFRIEVDGEWPEIDTVRAPLDLVIRNLADNAIKHHDRKNGTVRLSAYETPDALNITVSDDGPGIPAAHRQAVFLPFRTLMEGDTTASAGIGMGLALVERTLTSVGGTIALKSTQGEERGATFEVVWPKRLTV